MIRLRHAKELALPVPVVGEAFAQTRERESWQANSLFYAFSEKIQ